MPLDRLPFHASPASHARYTIAKALTTLCPVELGQEVAVTGSVAKGWADDASDIEQVFYVQKLPDTQERDGWLQQIGAENILHDENSIEDGSIWSTFRFQGVWIEAGWQVIERQETLLKQILMGQVLDHQRLILAEVTTHAFPLRSQGYLSTWQHLLQHYPPDLAYSLVNDAIELWRFPHVLEARWVIVQRKEPLRLAALLVGEVHRILRILFAANHQWEPDWKWIRQATDTLAIKPDACSERIDAIFCEQNDLHRVAACLQLMYDTLVLLPATYNVERALITIRESLRMHGY